MIWLQESYTLKIILKTNFKLFKSLPHSSDRVQSLSRFTNSKQSLKSVTDPNLEISRSYISMKMLDPKTIL